MPPGHKHTQEGVSRQQSRALKHRDAQLKAQPSTHLACRRPSCRNPTSAGSRYFARLACCPGVTAHAMGMLSCAATGAAGELAEWQGGVIVMALCAADGEKERGCLCRSHAPENRDGEPRADCMGEMSGVRLGVGGCLGQAVLLFLFGGHSAPHTDPGALPPLL